MRHNVTTPGGFFVGLGGIVAFCVVSALVYLSVKNPASSNELEPQRTALNLTDKQPETKPLLEKAAKEYNGGKLPNLNNLDDLRGVVRYREAQKSAEDSKKTLGAPSSVAGKTVLEAAIAEVAKDIATKKPVASATKVDLNPPAEAPKPPMPNLLGGGVHTVTFPAPGPKPDSK